MKRLITALLIVLIFISNLPFNTYGVENEYDLVWIKVKQNAKDDETQIYSYEVIVTEDNDIYFKLEDLVTITGFSMSKENNVITLTRGDKKLEIDVKYKKFYYVKNVGVPVENKIINYNNTIYISGATFLPWLNVNCKSIDNGNIQIVPDTVSFWDLSDEYNIEELYFDFIGACSKADVNNKWLRGLSFIRENKIKGLLYVIPIADSYVNTMDYYNIFDDMIKDDQTSIQEIFDNNDKTSSLLEILKLKKDTNTLPELQTWELLNNKVGHIGKAYDILYYLTIYCNDKTLKLEQISNIARYDNLHPNDMIAAAYKIEKEYQNVYTGITNKLMDLGLEESLDYLIDKTAPEIILIVFNITDIFKPKWNKEVSRIPKYLKIQDSCYNNYTLTYKDGKVAGWDKEQIQSSRSEILLSLYASKQCWLAMEELCKAKNKDNAAKEFLDRAKKCAELYQDYVNSSFFIINDSFNKIAKEESTSELLKIFTKIKKYNDDKDLNNIEMYELVLDQECEITGYLTIHTFLSELFNDPEREAFIFRLDHPANIYNKNGELIAQNITELQLTLNSSELRSNQDRIITVSGVVFETFTTYFIRDYGIIVDNVNVSNTSEIINSFSMFDEYEQKYLYTLAGISSFYNINYMKDEEKIDVLLYEFTYYFQDGLDLLQGTYKDGLCTIDINKVKDAIKWVFNTEIDISNLRYYNTDFWIEGNNFKYHSANGRGQYYSINIYDITPISDNSYELKYYRDYWFDEIVADKRYMGVCKVQTNSNTKYPFSFVIEDDFCKNIIQEYGTDATVIASNIEDCGEYYQSKAYIYDYSPFGLEYEPDSDYRYIRIRKDAIVNYSSQNHETGQVVDEKLNLDQYANYYSEIHRPFDYARMWNIIQDENGYIISFEDNNAG